MAFSHGGSGQTASRSDWTQTIYDQHFKFVDQDGAPISRIVAHVRSSDGAVKEVTTNAQRKAPIFTGRRGDYINLMMGHGSK
jgi:hypothetical protein